MKKLLLKTMLLLCVLVAGMSSAWGQSDMSAIETSNATLTGGTNGSTCEVNKNSGIKVGTSKAGGDMTVTVPAGTKYLHLHAAAWNGVTGLSLNISGATSSPTSISLTADTGVANNSPFTLSGNADDYYFVLTLSGIDEETDIKFTSSLKKRFVVWGVNYEIPSTDPELTVDPTSASPFSYVYGEGPSDDQMFEITGSNLTSDITASITGDYEMTDDSSYGTGDLTLSSGDVVSVRLKAGLAKGTHNGTLTFSSTGADDVVIALNGSVTGNLYTITIDDEIVGGSVVANTSSAEEGSTITLTATPAAGYAFSTWNVKETDDTPVSVSENTFVMPANNVSVSAAFIPFTVTLDPGNGSVASTSWTIADVSLPNATAPSTWTFVGWSTTKVSEQTTTNPGFVATNYVPTSDITLYAVYKRSEGGETPSAFKVGDTGDYAIVSEEQGGKFYALPVNPSVSSSGKITAQEITVSEVDGVKYVTPADASGFSWTIEGATNGYTLSDGSKYIYHSNGGESGTSLTYGTSTSYTWSFTIDGDYVKMFGMSGSTVGSRGLIFSDTTIGGYSFSNWGATGYYKTMILPIVEGPTIYYCTTVPSATINLVADCTDGEGNYYATYSNSSAFVVPEGLTVSTVSVADSKLTKTNYATGDVVKANTGVLVSATTAGEKTVYLTSETGTELAGNMLKASSVAMDAAETEFFRLTMHEGTQIGFFWGAEDGAAFSIGANKAYLAVPAANLTSGVRGFSLGEETDGISTIDNAQPQKSAAIYDLSGRRVVKPTKGLYIVNGKKVVK